MSFFAVENLGVRFGGVIAVDSVSFSVAPSKLTVMLVPVNVPLVRWVTPSSTKR